ncbi:MAG: indole-3-glycerol phosphate synthase TrpC [Thermoanaerobaculales bacterium]|nr:indole-3-glycerol phosphate synthase TrpC [Thermoanaerobaculales bacterium]
MGSTILDRIVAAAERRMAACPQIPDLEAAALTAVGRRRDSGLRSLREALSASGPQLLAECKHASPSAGILREPFDPVGLARSYEKAGAAAISVVVEPEFFLGDPAWIPAVRETVTLPVLRKDFIFTERQLWETALLGADAVLLIQRLLSPGRTRALLDLAKELEIEVLLEIFIDEDPRAAVDSRAEILGVNARDLATFEIRLDRVRKLGDLLPSDRVRVAESGIRGSDDVRELAAAGYDAFLVGETLVRADDPERAAAELMGR